MIYLATPYSKYSGGIWPAYKEAARIAGQLTVKGLEIYSPIVHSHPLAIYGDLNPYDAALWKKVDAPFMALCSECIVAMMAGWRDSVGVAAEITEFQARKKPVRYLDPASLQFVEANEFEGAA